MNIGRLENGWFQLRELWFQGETRQRPHIIIGPDMEMACRLVFGIEEVHHVSF
jgi:hypothetical protein